jgi:hypothetical protein
VSDDRTPNDLGIGPAPEAIVEGPDGADRPVPETPDTTDAGAAEAADGVCQKADWLAATTELPTTDPPAPAEPTRDRLHRWGREYGGYLAAGVVALVVLICAVTGLPGADMTWHAGSPGAAEPPPAVQSPSAAVESSPAGPSPTPTRTPTKRPAAASRPRSASSPTRSPSPAAPTMLGPADGWALAGIVNDYCDRRFDRSGVLLRPWQGSGAEDNWACQRRRRTDVIMANMTDACVVRYGSGSMARYLNAKDPFSWRCYHK